MPSMAQKATLADAAELLWDVLPPGHRVEVLQGRLTARPHADGSHALSLTELGRAFERAGIRGSGLEWIQALGIWLASGPDDYAVPDFAVVDKGFLGAVVEKNCHAPHVFRLVLEVTCVDWADALGPKAECYAQSGVPVYVVVDRKHDEVLLFSEPVDGVYPEPVRFKRGQTFRVPESVGVSPELSVNTLLDGD
ncbi:Uma2 family endonuclease [Streptomyces luteolus]|uniref:Uma2 family endonuclease n=1 Tax=Streptomyces luteolus TaxID=3043615 RepID=A0ABT6T796_9ACTN|nr:Uma2 family endonuclease [Streptomyces sp. B-S-A12]MDI3423771.1 Uma2 family endonuclease [Streptomyces sp. B-S-A12]